MFDVAKLTLDQVGDEIDKTINKLERLQALYASMQAQNHREVKKLIEEWNELKRKEKESSPPADAPTTVSK